MDLARAIKDIRETRGLRPADMAKGLEMMQSNYARLEKRGDKLTIEQLNKIAQVLGVTTQYILDYAPSTTSDNERIHIDDVLDGEEVPEESQECILLKKRIEELENVIRLQKEVDSFKNEKLKRTKSGLKSVLGYIEAVVGKSYLIRQYGRLQSISKEDEANIEIEKITHPFAVSLKRTGLLDEYLDPNELEPYLILEENKSEIIDQAMETLKYLAHTSIFSDSQDEE